jgi:hypothetical protein
MMIRVDGLVLYVRLGNFVWGMVGVRNLCYNWAQFFIELGFNSPTSYFVLYFVHVGFVLGVGLYSCNFFLSNQRCNLCACLSCFKN